MGFAGQHLTGQGGQLVLARNKGVSIQLHAHPRKVVYVQVPFATIAMLAARHGILPIEGSTLASWNDVIEGQFGSIKASVTVLTLVLVPEKDVSFGKGRGGSVCAGVVIQYNDAGELEFPIGGSNHNVFVGLQNLNLANANRLDGFLPRPQAEW